MDIECLNAMACETGQKFLTLCEALVQDSPNNLRQPELRQILNKLGNFIPNPDKTTSNTAEPDIPVGNTLTALRKAHIAGNAKDLFPVGTYIWDTWNDKVAPHIVAHYTKHHDARIVYLIRKHAFPFNGNSDGGLFAFAHSKTDNDYTSSAVRQWLTAYGLHTYSRGCSRELFDMAATVAVPTHKCAYLGSEVKYDHSVDRDRFFVPSCTEVGFPTHLPDSPFRPEGELWEYFTKNRSFPGLDDGKPKSCWLRTANLQNRDEVGIITTDNNTMQIGSAPVSRHFYCLIACAITA